MAKLKLLTISVYIAHCFAKTPLIPRKEFLSTADYTSVTMSKYGAYLGYIAPDHDSEEKSSRNIYVKELPNGEPKKLTNDKSDGIKFMEFSHDDKSVIYMSDPDGDENYSLFLVDIDGAKITVVDDQEKVQAYFVDSSPERPHEFVFKLNDRNPAYFDFYLFDTRNGQKKLIFKNDYYLDVLFNYGFQPKLAYNQSDDASQVFYKILDDGITVEVIKKSPPDARLGTRPIHIDNTNTSYWFDNDFTDKVELIAIDPSGKQRQVLYSPKKSDVADYTVHPLTGRPLWAYENYFKSEIVYFDESFKMDFACIKENLPEGSVIDISHLSMDMRKWLVTCSSDAEPATYYLYNRRDKSVNHLLSSKEKLFQYTLASTYPVEIKTSDGLMEVCYVTVPPDYDQSKNCIPSIPMPTIMFVHGGPNARDNWEFDYFTQYLANRNYVMIRCNYRASTGYGKNHVNAGNGEWGKKMQQDITDAANWAIKNKVADANKIGIAGGSYGGYATLAGLTFTPDLYACGVDIVGPSNLVTLLETIPEYWKPVLAAFKLSMGGNGTAVEFQEKLKQSSPVNFANRIKKPLLIGQGANDPRVKQAESDQIFEALKSHHIPVTYVLFSNEGHGFSHQENNFAFFALAEKFLHDCLGGLMEPATDEIEKSTAKIMSYNGE